MIVNFNAFKEFEAPLLRLCNANDTFICNINNPADFTAEFNFNDFSTISFRIDYMTDTKCYEEVCVRKEVYLGKAKEELMEENGGSFVVGEHISPSEDCGYFVITNVEDVKTETERYKLITAKSCEYELSNIAMPYIGENDGYNTFGSRVLYHATDESVDLDSFEGYSVTQTPSVMRTIKDRIPGWVIMVDEQDQYLVDYSADKATLPSRKFETSDSDTVYGFLTSTAAEAFGCVFLFDIYNRIIYIKSQKGAITNTDIVISGDNLLENISIKESEDDRVNCAQVTGGDDSVTISSVNPLGKMLYYFTEEYDGRVMSGELWNVVREWMDDYVEVRPAYVSLMKDVYSLNTQISTLTTIKSSIEQKRQMALSLMQTAESMIPVSGQQASAKACEVRYYSLLADEYYNQIKILEAIIGDGDDDSSESVGVVLSSRINSLLGENYQSLNDRLNVALNGVENDESNLGANGISDFLDFKKYIHSKINDSTHAEDLYSEFVRVLRVYSYTNSNIVMSDDTKTFDNIDSYSDAEKYDYTTDAYDPSSDIDTVEPKINDFAGAFNSWVTNTIPSWVSTSVTQSIDKQFAVIQELYDDVYDDENGILKRISKPRCDITIDSSNFVFVDDFEHISKQLKTGCAIMIERPDGTIQNHHVLKINMDYSQKEFSMSLSNRYRLDDPLSLFEDSYGNTSSIASIATSNATILERQKKQIDALDVARRQSLNETKQSILSAENQEIVVDDSGMIVRTIVEEDGEKQYDKYQFKLANGSILFTDDSWRTASLAVGRYYDPRIGDWRMGINGEHIMANTIEASSLTVGNTSNVRGTNLIKDGSFNSRILGGVDDVGDNVWMLSGMTYSCKNCGATYDTLISTCTECGSNDIQTGYDPRTTPLKRNYIHGIGNTQKTEEITSPLVRLGSGTSLVRGITIPALQTDSEWHVCMFLRGNIKINAKCYNPTDVSNTALKANVTGKRLSYINTSGEGVIEGVEVKNLGCVELFSVTDIEDGDAKIELEIMFDDSVSSDTNYAEMNFIFITNKFGNCCNLEDDTTGSMYAKNYCSKFTAFPDRFWALQKFNSSGSSERSNISKLPVAYNNITKLSDGLEFSNSGSSANYILLGKKGFSLEDAKNYSFSITVSNTNATYSSIMINSYIVKKQLMMSIYEMQDIQDEIEIGSLLDNNEDGGVLNRFSTYIKLNKNAETKYDDIQFTADGDYDDVCIVCVISVSMNDSRKIHIKSISIRESSVARGEEKEISFNPWCDKPSKSFLYFSYDLFQHYRTGGFDDGSYIAMPSGTGLIQREKFNVFEGLPYYLSCYVKGHFDMHVYFYGSTSDSSKIDNGEETAFDYYFSGNSPEWTRFHCETPIVSPAGAKYANVLLHATEDEEHAGCMVDGVMFEQGMALNAYQSADSEVFTQYTAINNEGVSIYNGKIRIYNSANNLVLHGDSEGNLEIVGKITAGDGEIGGWKINKDSLSSNNGLSIIDPKEGAFISKADDETKSMLNSGYLNFERGLFSGYIGFSGDYLSLGSNSSTKIMKDGKEQYPIIEFGDTITTYRSFGNKVSFENGLVSDGEIVSTTKVYSGGFEDLDEVVTFRYYNSLATDVGNLYEAFNDLLESLDNVDISLDDMEASTGGTTSSDTESEPKEIEYNWHDLLEAMIEFSGHNNAYAAMTDKEKCYSVAKNARYAEGENSGNRVFEYFSNPAQTSYAAYVSWSNTCGHTIIYKTV